MQREDPFNPNTTRGLAHGEGGLQALPTFSSDHVALEHLGARLLSLDHPDVDTHAVTRAELGHFRFEPFGFDALNHIHHLSSFRASAAP